MSKNKLFFIIAVVAWASFAIPLATTRADANPGVPVSPTGTERVLHLRITAYSSSPDETDWDPLITAMGTEVHDGVVAINVLPFGTKIKIPALFGNKIFTVEDRTARRIKNTADIWMTSKAKALKFGVAYADVVIMNKNSNTQGLLAEK